MKLLRQDRHNRPAGHLLGHHKVGGRSLVIALHSPLSFSEGVLPPRQSWRKKGVWRPPRPPTELSDLVG